MVVVGANYVSFVERMFVEVMLMCRSFTECVGEPSFWYLSLCKLILLGQLFLISDMTKAHPWPPHFRMIILIQAAQKNSKMIQHWGFVLCACSSGRNYSQRSRSEVIIVWKLRVPSQNKVASFVKSQNHARSRLCAVPDFVFLHEYAWVGSLWM